MLSSTMLMFYTILIFIGLCSTVYYFVNGEAAVSSLTKKNQQNIEDLAQKNKLVCVQIRKDGCVYCKKVQNDFDELASEFSDFVFVTLNQSENEAYVKTVREKYKLTTVPAFILFQEGIPKVIIGSDKLKELRDLLNKAESESEEKKDQKMISDITEENKQL